MAFESSNPQGAQFLKKRFDLHNSEEAKRAKIQTERLTGETLSHKPEVVIDNYLERFERIFNPEDKRAKERNRETMKRIFTKSAVIKEKDIPESYFDLQRRIARERGQEADFPQDISPAMRSEAYEIIATDQKESLEYWIDYLSGDDAPYPTWAKYWAMRSVLSLGEYDKEKQTFPKRTKTTTSPFPDLNQEALATAFEYIQNQTEGKKTENPIPEPENAFAHETKAVSDADFQKLLTTENFARYYAFAIEHVVADTSEMWKRTEGEWRVFPQGSNPEELTGTLQGKGTGWCTAGTRTAETQLQAGEFHVYYSQNDLGENKIPRLAIRMEGDQIAEVRGVAFKQEVDPYIADILTAKMDEFGTQGDRYKKKAEDMKYLTEIDHKVQVGETLTREDLRFLYEMDGPIEGFGYRKDPRIIQLLDGRQMFLDAAVIFNCTREQVATSEADITPDTKVYIGVWSPSVLEKLPPGVEAYRSNLWEKVLRMHLTYTPKTGAQYQQALEEQGIKVYDSDLLEKHYGSDQEESLNLVEFSVQELGFPTGATYEAICTRAQGLGLTLCPKEVGPELRLRYQGDSYLMMAMEALSNRDGDLRLWYVSRDVGVPFLDAYDGAPDYGWVGDSRFVFVARK